MKYLLLVGLALVLLNAAIAQQAMDFNMSDCNNNMHHLFADYLDNEEVVIMEFFMECPSCVLASQSISPMFDGLAMQFPGMVHFFTIAYDSTYTCSNISTWASANTPNAIPFDSGEVQVVYYGGFAMPTVVVVAGSQHQVLYNSNFDEFGDTVAIKTVINNFFNPLSNKNELNGFQYKIFPNPAKNFVNIKSEGFINNNNYLDFYIIVINTAGQKIFTKKITNQNEIINVESWENGAYFINIVGKNINETKKIIINR